MDMNHLHNAAHKLEMPEDMKQRILNRLDQPNEQPIEMIEIVKSEPIHSFWMRYAVTGIAVCLLLCAAGIGVNYANRMLHSMPPAASGDIMSEHVSEHESITDIRTEPPFGDFAELEYQFVNADVSELTQDERNRLSEYFSVCTWKPVESVTSEASSDQPILVFSFTIEEESRILYFSPDGTLRYAQHYLKNGKCTNVNCTPSIYAFDFSAFAESFPELTERAKEPDTDILNAYHLS